MTDEPELTVPARDAIAEPGHARYPAHPAHAAPAESPLTRVTDLIRNRPVVLVAAVAAGFVLGRLLKRVLRSRTEATS